MISRLLTLLSMVAIVSLPAFADPLDPERDILVTFENEGARATTAGAPYRARKRYAISADALRRSTDIAREYGLQQVDHWPIDSLSVYCFVYRIGESDNRSAIIERLRADVRVESAQELNEFETGAVEDGDYDDTYANLQHGLSALNLSRAHRYSRGKGVRIAVIDSNADTAHEDLKGRIGKVDDFVPSGSVPDRRHGTAVTSVIAARANNAKGIVGVAPEARLHLYVACWSQPQSTTAVCDSFSLARALDSLLDDPPNVLNLSLAGPQDPLLERLLRVAHERGIVLVAASSDGDGQTFPAGMDAVIAVHFGSGLSADNGAIFAPGQQILVAAPDNNYDLLSGSSLAAAHVSGVVALMLALSPGTEPLSIQSTLEQSQARRYGDIVSVDACRALQLADPSLDCGG